MVDDRDSKSRDLTVVRVQVPPRPHMTYREQKALAYIVGVALGDGNLSNPNGRAVRLRITCCARYPGIRDEIITALRILFSKNKVSVVPRRKTFYDISVYSNKLSLYLPWESGKGSKIEQGATVPGWIFTRPVFIKECLRGLIQTDGSIYIDRGYKMINFTNSCKSLIEDVLRMFNNLGFAPSIGTADTKRRTKYTLRVARDVERLCSVLKLRKV